MLFKGIEGCFFKGVRIFLLIYVIVKGNYIGIVCFGVGKFVIFCNKLSNFFRVKF